MKTTKKKQMTIPKWLVSFVSTGSPLLLVNLDFESFATVRENSSFDFGVNDDTVKEADGSSSSSGVGSTTRTNDTELTDLEKDETKKRTMQSSAPLSLLEWQ